MLAGSNGGELKLWNFNSGSQLREYVHKEEHVEYSALLFVHDEDRQSNQVNLLRLFFTSLTDFCTPASTSSHSDCVKKQHGEVHLESMRKCSISWYKPSWYKIAS